MRTVAVSGTRNTFQPRLSKKVARCAWPVVLPPQGPPVSTSLCILLVGGIGSFTCWSFILCSDNMSCPKRKEKLNIFLLWIFKVTLVFFCLFSVLNYKLCRKIISLVFI